MPRYTFLPMQYRFPSESVFHRRDAGANDSLRTTAEEESTVTHSSPENLGEVTSFKLFDPNEGTVVRQPPGEGAGYWVGAPGAMYDEDSQTFYLTYRLRRPRGVLPDRGAETRIAQSSDGVEFEDIWSGHKETLDSTSIERNALTQLPNGDWALYISYVDPADKRWRIDLVISDNPAKFDLDGRRPLLTAADIDAEGVKDPFVFHKEGRLHMIASYATAGNSSADELHGTFDAYNTGLIKSRTGLATSSDGTTWEWEGEILGPSESGWDCYCARIGTAWQENGNWVALYDGSADVSENYEERVGLAIGPDLFNLKSVSPEGPIMVQPNASGALRYFDVVQVGGKRYIYYETARADGSHDLRVWITE